MRLFQGRCVWLPAVRGQHLLERGGCVRKRACNGIDRTVRGRASSIILGAFEARQLLDIDQRGAGVVTVEELPLQRRQISGGRFLKLDLGPTGIETLENKCREPVVALEIVSVSAAPGQFSGRASRRLNPVLFLRP